MTFSNTQSVTWATAPTKTLDVSGVTYAYRELGPRGDIPAVFLTHLAAVLDNWDPRVVDGIAARRHVITFDNRGVGASTGKTPKTIEQMAAEAVDFIDALGHDRVDLFAFSMGGMIAQVIARIHPDLVHKMVIAGTGPAGGEGITKVTRISWIDTFRGLLTHQDPKVFLFFTRTANGKSQAKKFIDRLAERTVDRDKKVSVSTFTRQLKAIKLWGKQAPQDLASITTPTLVVNGDDDKMVPTSNSYDLDRRLPNSKLIVYPDAGHGGVFQFNQVFVPSMLDFLAD
jgi:pimeloyl-ACP methyl ester carboxylesterase